MKTIKITLISILIMTLTSCKSQIEKDIVGDWLFEKTVYSTKEMELPPIPGNNNLGFSFKKDGSYENKTGFWWQDTLGDYGERHLHYYGNISKYKIEDDSLKLYNPVLKSWNSTAIVSVTKDTLTLKVDENIFQKYSKINYNINTENNFDQIIVSSSGCLGTCPIGDISIKKNGDVIYNGTDYNIINGYFEAKITPKQFELISKEFKKANIETLEEEYYATHTDDETITVTFIKKDTIYKTILDYGHEAPATFNWAYKPVRFLNQKLELIPSTNSLINIFGKRMKYYNQDVECLLKKSETFFLITELEKGKEVTTDFETKYFFDIPWNWDGDNENVIKTDGRYYKLPSSKGGKTIDLGYNFISRNNLKFREIDF